MKGKTATILPLAALFVLSAAPIHAAGLAVGAKAGTLGVGVELTAGLSRQVDFRLGANGFSRSERREASGIEYDATADLRTATALLDWHPGGGGFRLTGGLVYNATEVDGRSLPPPSGTYPIGDVEVPVSLLGRLDGKIEFDPVVPYASLGWGNALTTTGRLGFSVDLGAVFQGQADVKLTPVFAPGSPIPGIPGAEALLGTQLRKEERDIEDDISKYDWYPVLSFGLTYRF